MVNVCYNTRVLCSIQINYSNSVTQSNTAQYVSASGSHNPRNELLEFSDLQNIVNKLFTLDLCI